jgi:ferredoxin
MAHVVAEPCIKCKYMDCIDVCPVECFHEGVNFVVIDPEECIDCRACIDECPVRAIYPEGDLPPKWYPYMKLNRRLAKDWPLITKSGDPLPTAEAFKDIKVKAEHLIEVPGTGDGVSGGESEIKRRPSP